MCSGPDSQVDHEGAAYFGYILDEEEEQLDFPLWPENFDAIRVFQVLQKQWERDRRGVRIGMRYEAIPPTLMLMGIKRRSWPDLFEDIRLMEDEALGLWNDK